MRPASSGPRVKKSEGGEQRLNRQNLMPYSIPALCHER